jgi:hypothetical protein
MHGINDIKWKSDSINCVAVQNRNSTMFFSVFFQNIQEIIGAPMGWCINTPIESDASADAFAPSQNSTTNQSKFNEKVLPPLTAAEGNFIVFLGNSFIT